MADSVWMGVDVGTSGVKANLVARDGQVLASALAPLAMSTPHPGWAEQDPDAWWDAALAAIRRLRDERPGADVCLYSAPSGCTVVPDALRILWLHL